MSQEYMVLLVEVDEDAHSIDGAKAEVFMRFTEEPTNNFLQRLARANRGKRVYCLTGASNWHSAP